MTFDCRRESQTMTGDEALIVGCFAHIRQRTLFWVSSEHLRQLLHCFGTREFLNSIDMLASFLDMRTCDILQICRLANAKLDASMKHPCGPCERHGIRGVYPYRVRIRVIVFRPAMSLPKCVTHICQGSRSDT